MPFGLGSEGLPEPKLGVQPLTEDGIRRLRNLCYKRSRVLKTASLNAREEESSSGIDNVEKAEALRDVEKIEGLRVGTSGDGEEEIRHKRRSSYCLVGGRSN